MTNIWNDQQISGTPQLMIFAEGPKSLDWDALVIKRIWQEHSDRYQWIPGTGAYWEYIGKVQYFLIRWQ